MYIHKVFIEIQFIGLIIKFTDGCVMHNTKY